MKKPHTLFYRNNQSLIFDVFDKTEDINSYMPTVIIYVNKGYLDYRPYIFEEVNYIKSLNDIKSGFQYYFVLCHNISDPEKLETFMKSTESDLKTGLYFPFGEVDAKLNFL